MVPSTPQTTTASLPPGRAAELEGLEESEESSSGLIRLGRGSRTDSAAPGAEDGACAPDERPS